MWILFFLHRSAFMVHRFREPVTDQRGLAETGGSGDQGQFTGQSRVQLLEQAQARDSLGPGWGLVYLGG